MGSDNKFDNVHSIKARAGSRRTYFFDVKESKGSDYYISITESSRKPNSEHIERHKILLYKEDFFKFIQCLQESIDFVKEKMPDFDFEEYERRNQEWKEKHDSRKEEGGESTDATIDW